CRRRRPSVPPPRALRLAPLAPEREEVVNVFFLRVAHVGVAEQLVEAERAQSLFFRSPEEALAGFRRLSRGVGVDVRLWHSYDPRALKFAPHSPSTESAPTEWVETR